MEDWKFDAQRAAAVEAPVLSILGTRSGVFFEDGRDLIRRRWPQSAHVDIPRTNHLLNLLAPEATAVEVARFLRP